MRRRLYSAVFLSSVLMLSACNGQAKEGDHTTTKVETAESDTTKNEAVMTKKVKNLVNTFPQQPAKKIVTTSVTIAEMLNILHITPVGLPTTAHTLPTGFETVEKIGTAVEPDIERIVSLSPDLVIGPDSIHTSLNKKMANTKIPAAYLPTDSYNDLKESFKALAIAQGQEQLATTYLEKLEKQEQKIIASHDVSMKKVMIIFGSGESFMLMNTTTYVGSLVEKLGATNIVAQATKSKEAYVPMNMEDVVATNPDSILLVSHGDAEVALKQFKTEVKKNGAWNTLSAFKTDQVAALDYKVFGYSSIVKAPQGLAALQEIFMK